MKSENKFRDVMIITDSSLNLRKKPIESYWGMKEKHIVNRNL